MIQFYRISLGDAEEIATCLGARLRTADATECTAAGFTPRTAILRSIRGAFCAYAACEDGEPIAAWGAEAPMLLGDTGYPWLLTGPQVLNHRKLLLRETRSFVEDLQQSYLRLEAYVHADYVASIRWLGWLGFVLDAPKPYGPAGGLFRRAVRMRPTLVGAGVP